MRIIGLAGFAGSGKTTVAGKLEDRGFFLTALADPLKKMVANFLNVSVWKFEDREWKEREIEGLGVSPRRLLQCLGTEGGRSAHPDLWVRQWTRTIGEINRRLGYEDFVVSDVRFENEAKAVRDLGGKLIWVHREDTSAAGHTSETGQAQKYCQFLLNNDGTLDDLDWKINGILWSLGWSDVSENPAGINPLQNPVS